MWKLINNTMFKELSRTCNRHLGSNILFLEKNLGQILSCSLSTLNIDSVEIHKNFIALKSQHNSSDLLSSCNLYSSSAKISLQWLRDHCRCSDCYNYTTNQRIQNILNISCLASARKCILKNGNLQITWVDNHTSLYPLDWLLKQRSDYKFQSSIILWNKNTVNSIGIKYIDHRLFMETEKGLKELMTSLVQFGVGLVENVPPTKLATQQVIERISHIQSTFFGNMWEFSDSFDHQDTAYSCDALGAHTDNTYFSEPAGLQVFHCLYHDGNGGETLLVDGFNAANCLKQKYPSSYQRLTETIIDFEYKENGKHYLASGPILKLNPRTGMLEQIRFNMYDRAPLWLSSLEEVQQFYKDFYLLSSIISDLTGEWWFKLHPGTVLFFNNWRILHGRASYTGHRKIAGCYIGNSDWCSKARILGLL